LGGTTGAKGDTYEVGVASAAWPMGLTATRGVASREGLGQHVSHAIYIAQGFRGESLVKQRQGY